MVLQTMPPYGANMLAFFQPTCWPTMLARFAPTITESEPISLLQLSCRFSLALSNMHMKTKKISFLRKLKKKPLLRCCRKLGSARSSISRYPCLASLRARIFHISQEAYIKKDSKSKLKIVYCRSIKLAWGFNLCHVASPPLTSSLYNSRITSPKKSSFAIASLFHTFILSLASTKSFTSRLNIMISWKRGFAVFNFDLVFCVWGIPSLLEDKSFTYNYR